MDPEVILSSIDSGEGIVFVDIGCGDGYFCAAGGPYGRIKRPGICSGH